MGEVKWSAECMAALNKLLACIFTLVRLVQPDLMGVIVVYLSLEGEACFVDLACLGTYKVKFPIAFVARNLTKMELKCGILTTLVSVTAWSIRTLCCYTTYSRELCIILLTTVDI